MRYSWLKNGLRLQCMKKWQDYKIYLEQYLIYQVKISEQSWCFQSLYDEDGNGRAENVDLRWNDAYVKSNLFTFFYFLLRYWMDGYKASYLCWYCYEFILECWEHVSGPAGLLYTRLEAFDFSSDSALHYCHHSLVVRSFHFNTNRKHVIVCVFLKSSFFCLTSGGFLNQPGGCWLMGEWRKPRSIWFSVLKSMGRMNTYPNWIVRWS